MLLRDAHVTLITTIEHLAVANLLNSKKTRALQLLRRVYHMQVDAFGVDNDQCKVTKNKIVLLEQDESAMPIAECSSILPVVETTLNKSSDSPNTSMLKVWRDHNGIGQKCEL